MALFGSHTITIKNAPRVPQETTPPTVAQSLGSRGVAEKKPIILKLADFVRGIGFGPVKLMGGQPPKELQANISQAARVYTPPSGGEKSVVEKLPPGAKFMGGDQLPGIAGPVRQVQKPAQNDGAAKDTMAFARYKPAVVKVTPDQKLKIVATMVAEAANEGEEGFAAVVNTAINRALTNPEYYGQDIFSVIASPAQYSGFGDNNYAEVRDFLRGKRKIHNQDRIQQIELAKKVLDTALAGKLPDNTRGATHYYASSGPNKIQAPFWVPKAESRGQIGSHSLYYLYR
jgi:cell wall hydrolase